MKNYKLFLIAFFSLALINVYAQSKDSLRMDSIIHALPEVMVKGEKPVVKMEGSKLLYDIPQLMKGRQVNNAWDALRLLPGVDAKENKLMLGASTVNVIIDGKVSTMSEEQLATLLKTMPASRLERAEVMYTAPAKMQVRGAAINVVLRHNNVDGSPITAEVSGAWRQQHDAKFNERASMLYQHGKLSLDAMYQLTHGSSYYTTAEQTNHRLDDGSVHDINSNEIGRSNGQTHDFRIGVDYDFAKNHSLSFVYTGSYERTNSMHLITGNITGSSDINTHNWLHNLRLDYNIPLGLKAGVEMTWYHSPEWQHTASTLPTGKLDYEVENNQLINRWKFYLSGEQNLGSGWSVNYGTHYTLGINRSRQNYVEVKAGTKPDDMTVRQKETQLDFYVGGSKAFSSKLSAEASLEAEYYHNSIWNEWKLYPTFSLTWQPAQGHMIQLGLSTDRNYPSYWALTNFITYTNGGYNEITGNPDLRPSTTTQLQLVYLLHNKYQFVAWWENTDNYFAQTPYMRHDRLAVSYKNLNFDFQQQGGIQIGIPVTVGKWLNSRLSLLGIWQREKNSYFYDIPFDRHIIWGMINLRNDFTVSSKPDISLSVDGMIRSKAIQATYDLPSSGNLDLAARWNFLNRKATLKLYCNDLLETNGINPYINYMGQNLRMEFSRYREVGVSFTYRFGGYKETKHEEVDKGRFGR